MTAKKQKTAEKGINTLPLYILLVVLFVIYILFQSVSAISSIVGIALFLVIIVLILLEVMNGFKEEGLGKNLLEIGLAVLAVVVFWFALEFLLHTSYPLDVVPSCSMLPNLKRGDLIVLEGTQGVKGIKAPIIDISNATYQSFQNNIQNEFLSCVAYNQTGNRATISQLIKPGYQLGLYKSSGQSGGEIVPQTFEGTNLIKYTCGRQQIVYTNGTSAYEAYTSSVTINGTTLYGDANNSVVVYATIPKDYFYQLGDTYIVHRAYAVLNVSGAYYVLTKGDNNPGLDLQYANYPSPTNSVEGRVLLSIPYLGYLKLVLSNSFVEPAGCNSTVQQN